MKTGIKIEGASALVRKFKEHPALLNRTALSVLTEEARTLCKEYARVSGPGDGLTETPLDKARKEVATDVNRVFATRDSPGRVFELMRSVGSPYANAYWHAYKAKKGDYLRQMAALVRKANLPQGMSADAQRAARTAAAGRVPKDFVKVSLANSASVRALIGKLQKRVGMAKAGWLCAAKAIGGRIRTKYDKGEKSVTVEVFPKSVRDVARKFPGLGGAKITTTDDKTSVEIFTSAGHARKALADIDYQRATEAAQQKIADRFLLATRELNKRFSGAA